VETAERDIDLVLITGAGASCVFGSRDKNERLVMMTGWSDALVKKLSISGTGYLEATGLTDGLSGPEFELRLGRFLRSATAFKDAGSLVGPSVQFQQWQPALHAQTLVDWQASVSAHLDRITTLIHETLYEEFGPSVIDTFAATPAYEWLFDQLQVSRTNSSVVVATTNYDPIVEGVLESMTRLPDWGAVPTVMQNSEVELKVEGLVDGLPRYTPVLHLHGRVGWYRRPDGVPRSTGAQSHQAGSGSPIVVLPDPNKAYEDVLLGDLWREFGTALSRAKKVFVLGHSLADDALIDAITTNVSEPSRVCVGWLSNPDNPGEFDPRLTDDLATAQSLLGGAFWLPIRFGREPTLAERLLPNWLNNLVL
jgi:hypothetical protein